MAEVTVLVVTQGQKDMLRLTLDSFRYYNRDVKFLVHVWENGDEPTRAWARENCDRLYLKDGPLGHHHAQPLDRMVQDVATPYVMTLDNDVCSKAPVLAKMLAELRTTGAFACGPVAKLSMGEVNHFGTNLKGQPRIDPCCAMFRTPQLARLVRHVSFTPAEVTNLGKFYDTGGLVRAAAEGVGLVVLDLPWMWDAIDHYGAMTWASFAPDGSPEKRDFGRRQVKVQDADHRFRRTLTANLECVVAKYKEDVSWISNLPGRVVVYDKADPALPGTVPLPNVGREAHTYAEHVARNYDRLAEVTAFVQGNPFDHAPDFLKQLESPSAYYHDYGPNRLETGPKGDSCHTGLPNGEVYRRLTGREFPGKVAFAPGACFSAHQSLLRKYPKSWWRDLADELASPAGQVHMPWVMERLWRAILTTPPLPHIYHNIVGWFSADTLYERMVDEAEDGARFVEVGSWVGQSTSFMATTIANSGKRIEFNVVDTFRGSDNPEEAHLKRDAARHGGSMRGVFDDNMRSLSRYMKVHEMDSVSAASKFPDNSLTFVYIDASHDEESVEADIVAWARKVKPGGWLGGDDYSFHFPGVIAATNRCFGYPVGPVHGRNWLWKRPG